MTVPRGIRNNNPGNIRKTDDNWLGSIPGTDDAFVTFRSPEYGIRAMAIIIRKYVKRGIDTIEEIIGTWAPASENDTQSYVNAICTFTGTEPDTRIKIPADLKWLIPAIIHHENGQQPYDPETIKAGIGMAGWDSKLYA